MLVERARVVEEHAGDDRARALDGPLDDEMDVRRHEAVGEPARAERGGEASQQREPVGRAADEPGESWAPAFS